MKANKLNQSYIVGVYLLILLSYIPGLNATELRPPLSMLSSNCEVALLSQSSEDQFYQEYASVVDLYDELREKSNRSELRKLYQSLQKWLQQKGISSSLVYIQSRRGRTLVLEISGVSDLGSRRDSKFVYMAELLEDNYRVVYDALVVSRPSSRFIQKKHLELEGSFSPKFEYYEENNIRYITEDYFVDNFNRIRKPSELGYEVLMYGAKKGENSLYHISINLDHTMIYSFFKHLNTLKVLSEKIVSSGISESNLIFLRNSILELHAISKELIFFLTQAKRTILEDPEGIRFVRESFNPSTQGDVGSFEILDFAIDFGIVNQPTAEIDIGSNDVYIDLLSVEEQQILGYAMENREELENSMGSLKRVMSIEGRQSLEERIKALKDKKKNYQEALVGMTSVRLKRLLGVFESTHSAIGEIKAMIESKTLKKNELYKLKGISRQIFRKFVEAEEDFFKRKVPVVRGC